jgi:aspartate kinase
MPVLVQKFGGSSVADADRIRRCAQRSADARREGAQVVVVVSAMGKTTDRLIELAHEICSRPPKREMDQLLASGEQVAVALFAMALWALGVEAVSMTGAQAGVKTDAAHTRARVRAVETQRIRAHLDAGRVVVAAGFQGVSDEGDTTTLGRGGSDTSAVILAAALRAERCEIYTDVPGVLTADPRVVPRARPIGRIAYEEMLELAWMGAKVMSPRSVLAGMLHSVPIHVLHGQLGGPGTIIQPEDKTMEHDEVTGVALKSNLGRVTLSGLPSAPGVQTRIFERLASAAILIDDIIQNELPNETVNISFTLDHGDLVDAKPVIERVLAEIGRGSIAIDVGLAKVSAVGVGMRTHTGVAARMFAVLAGAEGGPIRIQNITTSEIRISCILANEDGERAARAVHEAFGLSAPG